MATVVPFRCMHPKPAIAAEVAALPYDVFNRLEAAAEIKLHPQSFLRIDKSAALLDSTVSEYDQLVYETAASLFSQDINSKVYTRNETPAYYIYRIKKLDHVQTGIVACAAVSDYDSGILRRHENTRQIKLDDRIAHIDALKAQTGPVFVTYRAQNLIDSCVEQITTQTLPIIDFTAPDGVRHSVWQIDDDVVTAKIMQSFAELDAMYIADGHHRAAAAAVVAKTSKLTAYSDADAARCTNSNLSDNLHNKQKPGIEQQDVGSSPLDIGEAEKFLIVAFPANQLEILDYNRVVFDKNGLSVDQLLEQISKQFTVQEIGAKPKKLTKRGEFLMYVDGLFYLLTLDESNRPQDAKAGLDVSILHDLILAPILDIDDPKSSKRIAYVGGVRGLDELKRRADAAYETDAANTTCNATKTGATSGGVSFALYPCSLEELFAVADSNRLMPPKSTWFEPKPRSGLFIHEII